MLDTGGNMNTTGYPVTLTTPVSDCTALLILFQILFPMEDFNEELEQELGPLVKWGPYNFSMDDLPNPTEPKAKLDGNKNIKKTHGSPTSVEKTVQRIRRAVGNNDQQVAQLYNEIRKRYEVIANLTNELEECKMNNNAVPQPRSDNLLAQLKEKETEIRELREQIKNVNLKSQVTIDRLSQENQIKDEENQKLKEALETYKNNQERILKINNENDRQAKKLDSLATNLLQLQEQQQKNVELIAENARKDETIRNLGQQVARLREVEQLVLRLNAENSRKDQEILHLRGLADQLQQVQMTAYSVNAENSRRGEELLHLRTQMIQLQGELEACKSETGIGRIVRKKHEFINKLFGG